MSINIILQARTSSTRLPNKVLKKILAKPMLTHQLLRLKQVKNVDNIIVATSDNTSDDTIENLCDINSEIENTCSLLQNHINQRNKPSAPPISHNITYPNNYTYNYSI